MYSLLENILLEQWRFKTIFAYKTCSTKSICWSECAPPPSLTLTAKFSLWINTVSWKCPNFTCPFVLSLPPITVRSTQKYKEMCHHIKSQRHCLPAGKNQMLQTHTVPSVQYCKHIPLNDL